MEMIMDRQVIYGVNVRVHDCFIHYLGYIFEDKYKKINGNGEYVNEWLL